MFATKAIASLSSLYLKTSHGVFIRTSFSEVSQKDSYFFGAVSRLYTAVNSYYVEVYFFSNFVV